MTGVAAPCEAMAITSQAQVAAIPVRVTVSAGDQVVATETVRGTHIYRLSVTPGRYLLSSNALDGREPSSIDLHSGEVLHTNLYSDCI